MPIPDYIENAISSAGKKTAFSDVLDHILRSTVTIVADDIAMEAMRILPYPHNMTFHQHIQRRFDLDKDGQDGQKLST